MNKQVIRYSLVLNLDFCLSSYMFLMPQMSVTALSGVFVPCKSTSIRSKIAAGDEKISS